MSASAELVFEARRLGCTLNVHGENLRISGADKVTDQLLNRLRTEKLAIIQLLKMETAATDACTRLDNVTGADVLAALAPEDMEELVQMTSPVPFLSSFALALSTTRWRENGIQPPWWNTAAQCDRCGPVWLWRSMRVAGCPWCRNRLLGIKIPRPLSPTVLATTGTSA
ncbi:MAG: hypothetical protein ACRETA_01160 [Gammaproteobacteria bacterium]